MENTYRKCMFTGSLAAWIREISADVADFCFCQLLALLAQVPIFMLTFCL